MKQQLRDRLAEDTLNATDRDAMKQRALSVLTIAALAAVYVVAAKSGLSLAFVSASATPVWLPTGISLAALLLLGNRCWPAVFIGAFIANLTTQGSVFTCAAIATGNTLEALFGAYLVRRFTRAPDYFTNAQDTLKFLGVAAVISTMASPTVGVTSLALAGLERWSNFGAVWFTWWMGDMVSNILVAPLILIWATVTLPRLNAKALGEAAALIALVVLAGLVSFGWWSPSPDRHYPIEFLALPVLLWASFRYRLHGASTGAALLAAVALRATLRGLGPFAISGPNTSLLLLQGFMGTVTITLLVLASVFSERQRTEQSLREREEHLRLAVEAGRMGTWAWDIDTGRVTWSASLEAIHGLSPGSFDGTLDAVLRDTHPEDRERFAQSVARCVEQGLDHRIDYRIVLPDGRVRWVEGRGQFIRGRGGLPHRMVGICTDITERKLWDEALLESHQILNALMEQVPEGIAIADAPDVRLRSVSQYIKQLLGAPGRGLEGIPVIQHPELWPLYHPGSLAEAVTEEKPLVRAVTRGEVIIGEEWVIRSGDGNDTPILINAAPLRDASGTITGGVEVWRDIRYQKAAQAVLQEAYQREHRIAEVLQRAFVPEISVRAPNYDLAACYHPALQEAEVGGDFYDLFALKDGRIAVVLGDVSGKGLQAAVSTAMVKYMLRAFAAEDAAPASVVRRLNDALCRYSESSLFASLFYGVLDANSHTMVYTSAGHEPALVLPNGSGQIDSECTQGRVLGVLPGATYPEAVLELGPGCGLLLYTDGVTEAAGKRGDDGRLVFLGLEGLSTLCRQHSHLPAQQLVDQLYSRVKSHAGGKLRDDVVLLAVKRLA